MAFTRARPRKFPAAHNAVDSTMFHLTASRSTFEISKHSTFVVTAGGRPHIFFRSARGRKLTILVGLM